MQVNEGLSTSSYMLFNDKQPTTLILNRSYESLWFEMAASQSFPCRKFDLLKILLPKPNLRSSSPQCAETGFAAAHKLIQFFPQKYLILNTYVSFVTGFLDFTGLFSHQLHFKMKISSFEIQGRKTVTRPPIILVGMFRVSLFTLIKQLHPFLRKVRELSQAKK